jgi:glycosyltransferase involved in cell wall biosynthesis
VLGRVVAAAVQRGWRVRVHAPEGEARARLALTGAELVSGPDLRLPFGSRVLGLINRMFLSIRTARLLRRTARDSDVLLVNGVHTLPAVRMANLRIPSVWIVHGAFYSRLQLALVNLARSKRVFTVAVSEAAAEPVRSQGVPVEVIHNGTPWPVTLAPDDPPAQPVVGCAAALTGWKGQSVLLEAIARLDRSVRLELLGASLPKDAAYEASLRARANESDLSGRVTFLGFREDVLSVMRSWSVFVSSSVEPEAVGLTTLEAMSLGIPVVGTDHGATSDIVDGAGLLVRPEDAGAMAHAISEIVNSPDLWRRFHMVGPERIERHFSLDRQISRMLEFLEELARGGLSAFDHGERQQNERQDQRRQDECEA